MLLYDTVVRQKGGRFSVLAVIHTYYCGAFFFFCLLIPLMHTSYLQTP